MFGFQEKIQQLDTLVMRQYSQNIIKCYVFRDVWILKDERYILWTIRADMIPKQQKRLFVMMDRNAGLR